MTTHRRQGGRVVQLGSGSVQGPKFGDSRGSGAPFGGGVVSEVAIAMSERVLQAHIRGYLEDHGWVVIVIPDMRKTRAGWPDLCFWHPSRPGRLYCWELKREGRYPTPKQRAALAHLATVPGVDARLVRPSDWEALRDGLIADVIAPAAPGGTGDE